MMMMMWQLAGEKKTNLVQYSIPCYHMILHKKQTRFDELELVNHWPLSYSTAGHEKYSIILRVRRLVVHLYAGRGSSFFLTSKQSRKNVKISRSSRLQTGSGGFDEWTVRYHSGIRSVKKCAPSERRALMVHLKSGKIGNTVGVLFSSREFTRYLHACIHCAAGCRLCRGW